ncbi:hypothetical protein DES44_3100 [Roseateles depolymerans]|uniref:Uncharacterized protein n=2 Tax=Roseateles depolymerans TaxID=76731 RepID=A0A0U3MU19_9BURK|nr:hypothetical protein RD2015_884 [Roseateles depolymerans]REG14604.1 hypothetical protein DES44_3100 [Roseateles depolymerans]
MIELVTSKLHGFKSQMRRELAWRLPGNRCRYDCELMKLPVMQVFARPVLNNRLVDDFQLQSIAMAPSDGALETWFDEDEQQFGLEVRRSRFIERNQSVRSFIKRDEEGFFLHYDSVLLAEDAPAGFGAVAFFRAAQAAKAMGLTRVVLDAVGGAGYKMGIEGGWWREYNGYYSWPRFGFDAEITPSTRERLKETSFDQTATRLLDLIEWSADWWKHHGAGGPMVFDLKPGSRSWHTLSTYLRQRKLLR